MKHTPFNLVHGKEVVVLTISDTKFVHRTSYKDVRGRVIYSRLVELMQKEEHCLSVEYHQI